VNGAFRRARVDAWNGIAVVDSGVYMAGVGGHADWGGNEAYGCDLAAELPGWVMLSEPTPDAQIVLNVPHYLDGRPTSAHTYYSLHGDWLRKKVFRMGVGVSYGNGNFAFPNVDAFDLASKSWDQANRWPEVPEELAYAKSQMQHPVTGDIYVIARTRMWRFSQSLGTWLPLAAVPQNGTAAYARAGLIDIDRNRLVVLGNAYKLPVGILVYDLASNVWADNKSLSGADAERLSSVLGHAAYHHRPSDKYIVKTADAGEVLVVDPNTFAVTKLTTPGSDAVPAAVNGVFGKFAAIPALTGYVYQPHGNAKLWFLAAPT
jgi:hypothetical protein